MSFPLRFDVKEMTKRVSTEVMVVTKQWSKLVLLGGVCLAIGVDGAAAQERGDRAQVLRDAVACRAIADKDARLACYDRTVSALDQAESSDQLVVLDKAQVQKTRRSLFGLSLPKIKIFGGESKDDPALDRLDTVVATTTRDADDRLVFTVEGGARWRQIDDRTSSRVRPGTKVTLKRASFGSYFADFAGSVPVRVIRVN